MPRLKARPTTYNGIQMRSRLEARFASTLDTELKRCGATWRYEPECFADANGQYLPDFTVEMEGEVAYVEVKPTEALARADLEGRMPVIRSTHPTAELWAVWAEPLPADAYGPRAYGWRAAYAPFPWVEGVNGVLAAVGRSKIPSEVYEVAGWPVVCVEPGKWAVHVVVAPREAQRDAAIAVHRAHEERVWVVAAEGAAGGAMPMVEFDSAGDVTDRYPGGHHFTMSSTDFAMTIISSSDYRA